MAKLAGGSPQQKRILINKRKDAGASMRAGPPRLAKSGKPANTRKVTNRLRSGAVEG